MRVLSAPSRGDRATQPFNALLADALEERGVELEEFRPGRLFRERWDVVHFHWPEYVLRQSSLLSAVVHVAAVALGLRVARRRGAVVTWTVHNLRPHRRLAPRWLEWLWFRLFVSAVDGVLPMTRSAVPDLHAAWPGVRGAEVEIVPHGTFRPAYPPAIDRAEARAALGRDPDERLLLFVGNIDEYKGVDDLLEALAGRRDLDVQLLVRGRVADEALSTRLRRSAAADERVELVERFAEAEDLPVLFGAADLVVLPYRRILNSGSVLLALGYDRAVLVPRTPAFVELADEVGAEWVLMYDGTLTAQALADGVADAGPDGEVDLSARDWSAVAAGYHGLWRRLRRRD